MTLKREVEEAEQEVARVNAQKRKVQRDLDDQMEQNNFLLRKSRKYRPLAQARVRAPVKLSEDDSSEDGQEEQQTET
ncbi:myosin heavy chain, embryonic smooth muscle isoform-like [Littorina saxatilis]|uniref:myosin heavy chain, embryonic smooth muscle isoform-like n=1 Tax=Littorina saxatilis TaxID=31220 RepID=UPI0038B63068